MLEDIGLFEIVVATFMFFGAFFAFIINKEGSPKAKEAKAKDLSFKIQLINTELESRNLSKAKVEQLTKARDEKQLELDITLRQLRNNESEWSEVVRKETQVADSEVVSHEEKSLGELMREHSQKVKHCYVPSGDIEYTPSGIMFYDGDSSTVDNEEFRTQEKQRLIVALCKKQACLERDLKSPKAGVNKVELIKSIKRTQDRINDQVEALRKDGISSEIKQQEGEQESNVVFAKFGNDK